jgi:GxxExxY protein
MAKWGNEDLTQRIINACIKVHKALGPGFLEGIYHNALKIEFKNQDLAFESEKEVKVKYCDIEIGIHKIDLVVEGEIIIELKKQASWLILRILPLM